MNKPYQIFISFPRLEKEDAEELIFTKEYYHAKKLYEVLENLLGIHTFFCPESLLTRKKDTFDEEIERALKEATLFLGVSLTIENENRHFVNEERRIYLETREGRKPLPYFLVSPGTKRIIESLPLYKNNSGEIALYQDASSMATFFNTINTVIMKENKKIDNIKICKNCFRIFHDGNEKNSLCLCHDKDRVIIDENGFYFPCCNKHIKAKKNELLEVSPGCLEKEHKF